MPCPNKSYKVKASLSPSYPGRCDSEVVVQSPWGLVTVSVNDTMSWTVGTKDPG